MRLQWSSLLVGGLAALVAVSAACTSATPTPTPSEPASLTVSNVRILTPTPAPSPTPGQYTANADRGQAVFAQQCVACHGEAGEGGFAPALNTPEFQQEFAGDDALEALVRTGRGGMPAYGTDRLTGEQLADVVAYIRSLGSELPPPTEAGSHEPTPTTAPAPTVAPTSPSEQQMVDVSLGGDIYAQQCAMCHGEAGEGGFAPALDTPEFQQEFAGDDALEALVRTGRGGMPAFGSDRLTDQEMGNLIAYLRSLE